MYSGMGDDLAAAFIAFIVFVGIMMFGLGYFVAWWFGL